MNKDYTEMCTLELKLRDIVFSKAADALGIASEASGNIVAYGSRIADIQDQANLWYSEITPATNFQNNCRNTARIVAMGLNENIRKKGDYNAV